MKTKNLLLLAALIGAVFSFDASAHPYASGVTKNNNVISWVLNEPATDVKLIFDNGTVTNDLGSSAVVGTNTFSFTGHTNFSIVVYKVGSNALNQISSDTNINNSFGGATGVVVNKNAKAGNFGRIYVNNANPSSANNRVTTSRGVYVMDAASGDFLNLGNTAATAGMSLGTSTSLSPYKINLGPDDSVYVGDCAASAIGGIWAANPNLTASTNIFALANPSTNRTTSGTNFGRVIGTPNITGSLAAGNLALTVTTWDLNLANPPGTFLSTSSGYQNIYRYNIGAGPLPWKSFPTVITNPISYSTVNTVTMDVQVAPDGKYFITAYRFNPSEGVTNVCVLDSTGTVVLWDSKSVSKSHFGDSTVDHFDFANTSISVSPDDKFVLIQGSTNMTFLLMTLTNGVPDVSTLTTNSPASTTSDVRCWASTWDAADNIYVTSTSAQLLRVFSPGLTTTCVTSNDATLTNGSFSMATSTQAAVTIQNQPASQNIQCSSNVTFSVAASGTDIHYQWYSSAGAISGATNATLSLSGVSLSQSGASYDVVITNALNTVTSQPAVLTVVDTMPPVITLLGAASTNITQGTPFTDPGATAHDTCSGNLPVITNGSVNINIGGTNILTYVATDASGHSATNSRTVVVLATNGAPQIYQQPAGISIACTATNTLSVLAGGAPLSYQWYLETTPLVDGAGIAGSSTANLTLGGVILSQTGNYHVVITNSQGSITSQVASVTVSDLSVPVVTIIGSTAISVIQGTAFVDPGATAADACAGELPTATNGSVNVNQTGTYTIVYSATNSTGLVGTAQRLITVLPGIAPVTASTPKIIPLPVTLQTRSGVFTLCPPQPPAPVPAHARMNILVDSASLQTGQYLASILFKSTGYKFGVVTSAETNVVRNAILITTAGALSSLGAEGYELTVAPDSVVIRAPQQAGAFYGVQTLLQLLPPQIYSPHMVVGVPWAAPCVYVQDYPAYSWRGVMLDPARHFINKQEVEQMLDALAMHKLNVMHWHLVDDQSWCLEITNFPNLTATAAWRNGIDYGLNPRASTATNAAGQYGGFYTQADAREVVAYAAQRHITVVPEIEMPCHSTPGLGAYPQYGCGNAASVYKRDYPNINYGVDLYSLGTPGTMSFLKEILTEVMQIFPSKYIHCGGDEVVSSGDTQWNSYAADKTNMTALGITPNGSTSIVQYQHWFSTNISAFVKSKGRTMIAWTEFENGGVVPDAALMDWESGSSSQATNVASAGLPVVMSLNNALYINYVEGTSASLAIEPPFVVGGTPQYSALSKVYAFMPVPTTFPAAYASNVLGAQCNLWAEYVPSFRNVMFKIFPRESALAEVTWTPHAQQSFSSFTNRLAVHEQRLAQANINYDHEQIPQIGAWGPTVSTAKTTTTYDITTNVTAAGEIDVSFWYGSGSNLTISSVALLVNGVQVDIDSHTGVAEPSSTYQASQPYIPVFTLYVLHLGELKPGATYTIQAVTQGAGTSSSGTVYLPNWN